jgi:hypothetical protein
MSGEHGGDVAPTLNKREQHHANIHRTAGRHQTRL